ncbi:MAG: ankyrin repeat domain-containing protein [Deltaproteobacteria bacterium]|nr:ankyrin repeat domain-containing protein [Deltaproteobacteria bacterium]
MKTKAAALLVLAALVPSLRADAKEGFYIGIGMGGASVDGQRIDLVNNTGLVDIGQFGTDGIDSSFGMLLRFGYNILGYASAEFDLSAFGSNVGEKSKRNGAGLVTGLARYHPMEHFIKDYEVDPYAYFGLGYSFAGYQAYEYGKPERQSKGFRGLALQTGLGCDYYFVRWFSAGALVNFYFPLYDTLLYDWDEGIDYTLKSRPSTTIIVPMAVATFHFVPPKSEPAAAAREAPPPAFPPPAYAVPAPAPAEPSPPPPPAVKTDPDTMIEHARAGDVEKLRAAVKAGADVNAAGAKGMTPLWAAVEGGQLSAVKFLVAMGGETRIVLPIAAPAGGEVDASPMVVAAARGSLEIVKFLKDNGADVNFKGPLSFTPLMAAAEGGHAEVVKFLLSNGADPKLKDKSGKTAADYAKAKGHAGIVKLLRKKPGKQ